MAILKKRRAVEYEKAKFTKELYESVLVIRIIIWQHQRLRVFWQGSEVNLSLRHFLADS